MFTQFDEDNSGFLDRSEVKQLLEHMGLRAKLEEDPSLLDKMIADIEDARASVEEEQAETEAEAEAEPEAQAEADGQVELEGLLPWFLATRRSYLPKPVYPVLEDLEEKTDEELMLLFIEIDE